MPVVWLTRSREMRSSGSPWGCGVWGGDPFRSDVNGPDRERLSAVLAIRRVSSRTTECGRIRGRTRERDWRKVKHRKPSRTQRAMASTSLPLATAAAVATLFASPAGAVPNDPTTPATPAPVQPGTNPGTEGTQPGTAQPEQSENESESTPTPSQPGVTTPEQEQVMPEP